MDVLPLGVAAATADRATVVRFAALLATTVALVLLLGCVNVGTMLFVRGLERRRELGVHAVLGASRSRLFGRLFLESLLLSAGGGFAGIALAAVVIKLLGAYSLPGGIAIDQLDLSLNGRVFAFALALSAGTTAIFGVLPAVRASRPDPAGIFRMNVRMATGGGPRGGLITLQVAIALVILVAAGLFERSLRIGLRTDIGFDPAPLVALTIQPGVQGYAGSRLSVLYRQIADRVAVQPGVEAAALTSHVPLSSNIAFPMRAMGPGAVEAPPWPAVRQTYVSPGYFATMGVSFVSGRDFTPADRAQTEAVAILNESAARALWPGVDPIGRTVLDSVDRPYRVVGLVRDTKYESLLDRGLGYAYFPLFQEPVSRVSLVARGGRPEVTLAIIQRVVSDVDATLPILTPRLVADQVDALLMTQRFGTTLLSLFGVIALCIAVVGIHAVLAFAVTQRRSEIGIRVALGAQRGDVLRAILVRTATAVGVGVALGLTTAALTAHTIEHLLFGIPPLDFASFAGATAIFAVAVVLVALQPARRATRIDPIEAMRD